MSAYYLSIIVMYSNCNGLISFLQTFGIILVVIGHSAIGAPTVPKWHIWISSFHMPLFMFISGYLLKYNCKIKGLSLVDISLWGRNGFILKKAKRLLLPYLSISFVAFFFKYLLNSYALRPVDFSILGYIHMLLYPWDNAIIFFWFLPTLFIIFMLVIFFANFFKSIPFNQYSSSILLIFLFYIHYDNPVMQVELLNIKGVVYYILYFVLGYCYCHFNVTPFKKSPVNILYVQIIILALTSFLSVFMIPFFHGKDVLNALIGIWLSISIGQLYIINKWSFLNHLFGASYAIYLFSWFPQVASQQLFLNITHAPWQIGTVLAIFTGIYIPLMIHKWVVKNENIGIKNYIAWLIGYK